ncbi:tetratricopeptide repeat protein [Streptomyces coffeae]|uniref:Tetratricopeptide repeat protein n=1 Tax=Streptomyces coffeae TaxID=621382 RepID=A0ABS1NDF8_9ACTN|nr:tetratricopeptide repeat protein [Streptomyces coffeae]MBL1098121.1 tetratricopeptide repeat protein [Streptomyces coffeae]
MVEHSSHGTPGGTTPDTPGETAEAAALRTAAAAGEPGAYRAYAEHLTGQGLLDEALPWWARAADAGDPHASRTLAICHKDRGDFAEAERWYRTAAERDGGCAFGLARLLEESGDTAGAEEWYGRGAELGSVQCKTNGAVMLAARGEWDTALERLAEASDEGDDVAVRTRAVIEEILGGLEDWREGLAAAEAQGDPEAAYDALRELLDPDREGMYDAYPRMVAEAEALYARAAAVGSAKALVDQAIFIARDPGRFDEARALVERSHERGYDGAAYVLGVWFEERGDLRAAEQWYRTAHEADGGHLWACFNLGMLCKRQRRLDEAERWFRATGVDEDAWDPFDEGQERIVRALKDVAAIRADPERQPSAAWQERLPALRARAEEGGPDDCFAYADALDRLYRFPEAAEWYRTAGTPRALLDLGRMLYEGGGAKGTLMAPYYEPAAAEGDAEAAYDIGVIHDKAGDQRTAEIWFHRAAGLGHGRAAWQLGWTSQERGGDPQNAERWFVRAARTGLVPPAFLAGRSMVRRGAHAEAEPLLRTACDGDHLEAPHWLAKALRGLDRAAEAEPWLRRAVENHPRVLRQYDALARLGVDDPRLDLAEVLIGLDRDEEAGEVLADVFADAPGHRRAHRLAGDIARRRGDLEAAEKHFEEAVEHDPDGSARMSLDEIRALLKQITHQH